jgi:hypothetical protein
VSRGTRGCEGAGGVFSDGGVGNANLWRRGLTLLSGDGERLLIDGVAATGGVLDRGGVPETGGLGA